MSVFFGVPERLKGVWDLPTDATGYEVDAHNDEFLRVVVYFADRTEEWIPDVKNDWAYLRGGYKQREAIQGAGR